MHARDRLKRCSLSLLFPPLVILLVIGVLGMFRVSGSSVALNDEADPSAQALLEPRPIRTDEWAIRTPLVVRQAALDFPKTTVLGIGEHDTGVLSELPVLSASSIIKPHSWAYFVVDVERAFAIEWWLTVFGPLVGVYAVVAMITKARPIALLAGVIAAASPVAGWWTIPAMGLSVLYGGATTALIVAAARRTGWRRYACAGGAGWTAAAFASLLYLPWLIPLGFLFVAIVLTQTIGSLRGWRQWVGLFGTTGAVSVVLLAVFLKQHHVAIQAINDSVYPGDRALLSAEARPDLLFDAPFDVFAASRQVADISNTSQSEAASGLMLWLPIAIVGGAFGGFSARSAARRALTAVLLVSLALTAWGLLPVPSWLGSVFGLTNVQGPRIAFPLTIAGAIAAGLFVHCIREDQDFRPQRDRRLTATLVFVFLTGWVATRVSIGGTAPAQSELLALLVVVGLVTAAILGGRVVLGLGGACVLLVFGFYRINPIQIGLDPLTESPLMHQIDDVRRDDPTARWASIGTSLTSKAILAASGAPSVNGTSWYADPQVWHLIDPADHFEQIWNRYALISIAIDETVADAQIELTAADAITIRTPSCGGALEALDAAYLIADVEAESPCLELVQPAEAPGRRWIYRIHPPFAG